MTLTPHTELIRTAEAASLLGISLRELEYWKQLKIGPTPIIIFSYEGTEKMFFVKKEIENFKDSVDFHRTRYVYKKVTNSILNKRKPKFD